jgi:5-bromo-4-chloroindolyl phosphate hydrolysis protein
MLVDSPSFQSLQLSSEKEKEDKEAISKKILAQVNCRREPKLASISEFFSKNLDNLITLFDHLV